MRMCLLIVIIPLFCRFIFLFAVGRLKLLMDFILNISHVAGNNFNTTLFINLFSKHLHVTSELYQDQDVITVKCIGLISLSVNELYWCRGIILYSGKLKTFSCVFLITLIVNALLLALQFIYLILYRWKFYLHQGSILTVVMIDFSMK